MELSNINSAPYPSLTFHPLLGPLCLEWAIRLQSMRRILCCWSLLDLPMPVPETFILSEPLSLASCRDPASVLLPYLPGAAALLPPVAVGSNPGTHRRTDTQKDAAACTVASTDTVHIDTSTHT